MNITLNVLIVECFTIFEDFILEFQMDDTKNETRDYQFSKWMTINKVGPYPLTTATWYTKWMTINKVGPYPLTTATWYTQWMTINKVGPYPLTTATWYTKCCYIISVFLRWTIC